MPESTPERLYRQLLELHNDPRPAHVARQVREITERITGPDANEIAHGGIEINGYAFQRFIVPIDHGPGRDRYDPMHVYMPLAGDVDMQRWFVERQVREALEPAP